jgi:DNA helicase-2/ATP-dependent DNA helicase PcrA
MGKRIDILKGGLRMSLSEKDWEMERNRLASVNEEIEQQRAEAERSNQQNREEIIATRKFMWEDLTRDVSKADNRLDIVQHGLDLYRKERIYLFAGSQIKKLEKMQASPYFGRIDFQERGSLQQEQIYIGISSLSDQETGEMLVYDWRAPISSMFYDERVEDAQFESPEGPIYGEISLKRQFKIINGFIKYMFDNNLQIGDEMLQEMLGQHTSDKMKSIVTTIQSEQNQVIRNDQAKLLIVQGSAGSGKTSIALQRAAYLLYKHRETMNANQIMIFSPNPMFNDYISNVLPELGEQNVLQSTFQEYVEHSLPEDIQAEDFYDQMEEMLSFAADDPLNYVRIQNIELKASTNFVQWVKDYTDYLYESGMKFEDIKYEDDLILSSGQQTTIFFEQYKNMSLNNRLEEVHKAIKSAIMDFQQRKIEQVKERMINSPKYMGTDEEIGHESQILVKKRLKPFKQEIRNWVFSHAYSHYVRLFQDEDLLSKISRGMNIPIGWEEIRRQTLETLENRVVKYEDVVPLLYMKAAFEGVSALNSIRHVIIDEAQDYSAFHYQMMKRLFPRSSFTLLGDLNQSINEHMGVRNYKAIVDGFAEERASIVKLTKSYRSTEEIVHFTKALLVDGEGIQSVDRNGEKPRIIQAADESMMLDQAAKDIRSLIAQGFSSVAILCKTASQSKQVYEYLQPLLDLHLITKQDQTFKKGVVVVPIYLAKGLEYDAVILYQVNDDQYGAERDRKLLYTGCTRALHKLHLLYTGTLSPFVSIVDRQLYMNR